MMVSEWYRGINVRSFYLVENWYRGVNSFDHFIWRKVPWFFHMILSLISQHHIGTSYLAMPQSFKTLRWKDISSEPTTVWIGLNYVPKNNIQVYKQNKKFSSTKSIWTNTRLWLFCQPKNVSYIFEIHDFCHLMFYMEIA